MLGAAETAGAGRATLPAAPPVEVVVEVCSRGCTGHAGAPHPEPDWPLATAWAWLTRPVEVAETGTGTETAVDEVDAAALPWWDARASATRRRAVLPLVLLGELQAGVLLRAVWEVAQRGGGPSA